MFTAILVVHIIIAATLIVLVLLQHGKGADMGAAFGAGASGTVFGSSGSGNFLSRTTGYLGAGFFVTSLVLAMLAGGQLAGTRGGIDLGVEEAQPRAPADAPEAPAAPAQRQTDAPAPPPAQD